jgi:hypothetical protein
VPKQSPNALRGMAAAAVLLGLCCHSQADRVLVTASDNGRTVTARVGDTIEVALDAIGPFYFGTPVVSSMSVVFRGESDELPAQPNPGGGKTQRYTFEAVAVGRAEITIPRELPVAEPPVFVVTVQVY